jgi:hypothetical protein
MCHNKGLQLALVGRAVYDPEPEALSIGHKTSLVSTPAAAAGT